MLPDGNLSERKRQAAGYQESSIWAALSHLMAHLSAHLTAPGTRNEPQNSRNPPLTSR